MEREYGIVSRKNVAELAADYDAVILAVSHRQFAGLDVAAFGKENAVIFDIKGILPKENVTGRL